MPRGEGPRGARLDRRNPTPAGQKRPDLGTPVIAVIADIGKPTPTTEAPRHGEGQKTNGVKWGRGYDKPGVKWGDMGCEWGGMG
jgi:hypothetical protein